MKYAPRHYAHALLRALEKTPARSRADLIKHFVQVLSENNDMAAWRGVTEEFERSYNEKHHIQKVYIAAAAVDATRAVRRVFAGKKFSVSERIDPSLGGGAAIRVGDMMADNTVKARISKLRAALVK